VIDEEQENSEGNSRSGFVSVEDEGYEQFENDELLRGLINTLTKNEKKVLLDRLVKNKTQQELAAELHVSQTTISRMEREIKKKLRAEYIK
jgi:RNA polymerase sigma-B factor